MACLPLRHAAMHTVPPPPSSRLLQPRTCNLHTHLSALLPPACRLGLGHSAALDGSAAAAGTAGAATTTTGAASTASTSAAAGGKAVALKRVGASLPIVWSDGEVRWLWDRRQGVSVAGSPAGDCPAPISGRHAKPPPDGLPTPPAPAPAAQDFSCKCYNPIDIEAMQTLGLLGVQGGAALGAAALDGLDD